MIGLKSIILVFTIVFSSVTAILLKQNVIAEYVWEMHGKANVAFVLNKSSVDLYIQLGDYFFGGQNSAGGKRVYDLGKAKIAYLKARKLNAMHPDVHYRLARVYFAEGDLPNALDSINKELSVNPANYRSYYVRGLIYGFREKPGDSYLAESDFRKFVEWASTEWAGYNDLGWVLMKQGKYKEAVEITNIGIKTAFGGQDNPWLWNNLGVATLNLGDYKTSVEAFVKAKELAEPIEGEDWRRAYSGNDPSLDGDGLEEFKKGIEMNLNKALLGQEQEKTPGDISFTSAGSVNV